MESNLWWTNQRTSRMCEWSCILVNAVWVNGECSASGLQVRALWVHFVHFWVKHELAFCAFLLRSESVLWICTAYMQCWQWSRLQWVHFEWNLWVPCVHFAFCRVCILYFVFFRVHFVCNCKSAVLVKLAPGEASRGRPDTIRRPFPVISGASKCDGDCDDVRMSLLQIQIQTQTQNHMYAVPMKMNTTSRFW